MIINHIAATIMLTVTDERDVKQVELVRRVWGFTEWNLLVWSRL